MVTWLELKTARWRLSKGGHMILDSTKKEIQMELFKHLIKDKREVV